MSCVKGDYPLTDYLETKVKKRNLWYRNNTLLNHSTPAPCPRLQPDSSSRSLRLFHILALTS